MLSRVTFMCDDAKVGKACRVLVGIAAEKPEVQPMGNAIAIKTGTVRTVRQRHAGNTLPELIRSKMLEENMNQISASTIQVMAGSLGYVPKSSAKALADLVHKFKFLRRIGRGEYEVRT